ncbi:MAG: fasciclin domain-containing protein [Robiginitalea sp.]
MNLLKFTLPLAVIGSLTFASAQKSTESQDLALKQIKMEVNKQDTPTIVGVAASNAVFSTLVAAVKAADLVETLNSAGPFTVFAPTNDAFGKLPAGTVETLLKAENKGTLTSILTYHVVAGKVMAKDVVKAIQDNSNAFNVKTVQGGTLTFSLSEGTVMITDEKGNSSKVTATDVGASNGVIHVIDTVVMPEYLRRLSTFRFISVSLFITSMRC